MTKFYDVYEMHAEVWIYDFFYLTRDFVGILNAISLRISLSLSASISSIID